MTLCMMREYIFLAIHDIVEHCDATLSTYFDSSIFIPLDSYSFYDASCLEFEDSNSRELCYFIRNDNVLDDNTSATSHVGCINIHDDT